jgi:hypothetical protein
MGRGAAVIVRFDNTNGVGRLELREALAAGSGTQCTNRPSPGCVPPMDWNAAGTSQLITTFDPIALGPYGNVRLDFHLGNATPSKADICFTPMGRVFARPDFTGALVQLTVVPSIDAVPKDGIGLTRTVLIVPSGVTRVVTKVPP